MRALVLLFFISILSQAQTYPELTAEGVTITITEIDSLTTEQLYTKTKEWIQHYYQDPDESLKADIPNKTIRIEGFSPGFFTMQGLGTTYYDVAYTLEFSFKDQRYRLAFFVDGIYNKGYEVLFSDKSFFKRKDGSLKKTYRQAHETFNTSLKELYQSHYQYLTNKDSDW